jgi:hypothetical protein
MSEDAEIAQATDNLMMTQGWRRFKWSNVLQSSPAPPLFSPEYEGMIVSGKLTKNQTGKPVFNTPVLLALPGNESHLYSAVTDVSGKFQFYVKNIHGSNNLVLVDMDGNKETQLLPEDPFEDSVTSVFFTRSSYPVNAQKSFTARSIYAQVMEQFARSKPGIKKEKPDTLAFYGKPNAKYRLDDYVRFPTLEEVLREYVPEVIVRRQNKKLDLFALNKDTNIFFTHSPLLLIDGVPIIDHDKGISANMKSVEKLEVVTKKFFHGPLAYDGIVSLNTFGKDFTGFELDSTSSVFSFEGTQYEQEFYTPAYQSVTESNSRIPDFRNVLHWDPNIATGNDGKEHLIFYTGDAEGKFVGILHGLTIDGLSGSHSFSFEVRRNNSN